MIDEPSLGLSPAATSQVFDALGDLRAAGVTIVLVEEHAARAADLVDEIVLLDAGRVRWRGPAGELPRSLVDELYLGRHQATDLSPAIGAGT